MSFTTLEQTPLLPADATETDSLPVRIEGVKWYEFRMHPMPVMLHQGELVLCEEGVHFCSLGSNPVVSLVEPAVALAGSAFIDALGLQVIALWLALVAGGALILAWIRRRAGIRTEDKVGAIRRLPLDRLALQEGYLYLSWHALTAIQCGNSMLRLAMPSRAVTFQGKLRAAAPIVRREAGRYRRVSDLERAGSPLMRFLRRELW